jgi:hypothetical protein
MADSEYFAFEADFVESLRCIPMQVRYKLDTCGVKLKLQHWHQLSQTQRQELVERPCQTESEAAAYRDWLQQLLTEQTGEPAKTLPVEPQPAWNMENELPADVIAKVTAEGITLTLNQWRSLSPLQRFVLIKLSRPSHENKNFLPALSEFHLI